MIARAEAGQSSESLAEFDAAEIAHGVGELYEPLAEEKGLTLTVEADTPAPMVGNRELVTQALANLVDNAIKYGRPVPPPDGPAAAASVLIEARRDGDDVALSVSDRGPGIPEAERARALERFVRLDASRSQPGSGLGLSLASAVATLHGGVLRLEDNRPGLRAVLVLPAVSPESQPPANDAAATT